MFAFSKPSRTTEELEAKMKAISRVMAVIEFNLDGTVITANENFLAVLGYSLPEITGKHHSLFVDAQEAKSSDYRQFWDRLNRGEFVSGKVRRVAKGGKDVWIQASYNPLLDAQGKPYKIVKFATDITAIEAKIAEQAAKIVAIDRSQGTIEFNLDGTIITANENFLAVVGYTLAEIAGKHHSMFVDKAYAASGDYRSFWDRMQRGDYFAGKFRRVSKSGKEIWIQASYNPLLDANGKPFKVVKFAADITAFEDERRMAEQESAEKSAIQAQVVESLGLALHELTEGNLTHRMTEPLPHEYEQLRVDFNSAIGKLHDALKGVVAGFEAVRAGSTEIANASDDLSRRTETQAASLEQTTAALNEITSAVKTTAEDSRKASESVKTARGEAEHGGDVVREAIAAMRQIEESSQKVSQIIGVIDEIAFQTNLLALNAGVEAARAGEAGRGFAVVASEVRALAQRSADAAKEIKSLISTSTQQVETGAKLVGETGSALNRIVTRVNEISNLVINIASSAEQQATGLSQVNIAVTEMDQGTQKNAAMVEESTAAVHVLSKEADAIARHMNQFHVGATGKNSVRSELEKTVPHAFRQNASPKTAARAKPHLAAGHSRKAAATGTHDGWEEF